MVRSINGNTVTFDPIPTAPDNGGTARMGSDAVVHRVSRQLSVQAVEVVAEASELEWDDVSDQESVGNEVQPLCGGGRECDGEQLDSRPVLCDCADGAEPEWRRVSGGGGAGDAVVNNIIRNAGAGINILSDDYFGADAEDERHHVSE